MNQQWHAHLAKDRCGIAGTARRIRRDSDIQSLARGHGGRESAHRLLERGLLVGAVVIEDVDVIETKTVKALVEAREDVLARSEIAIRARPHIPTGLARDHELVAQVSKILGEDATGVDLGRTKRRAVVVREVEVSDAQIEGTAHDRALGFKRLVIPEVVPEAE